MINQGTDLALKELNNFVDNDVPLSRVSAALIVQEIARQADIIETLSEDRVIRGLQITELRKEIEGDKDLSKKRALEARRQSKTEKQKRLIGFSGI